MTMSTSIQAENRTRLNPSGLRNLRQGGRLPGVVFGKGTESKMIHISMAEFKKWLRDGTSGFIELQLAGDQAISVRLEDLQRNPVTQELLHVDFLQADSNEIMRTKIPVKFNGTPVGTKNGGVVLVQSTFIEVEALPKYLPPAIELDITNLNEGESLSVKDVDFPAEVTVITGQDEFLVSVKKS